LKLELQDIEKEIKTTSDQVTSLKDKIAHEETQLEQLTKASDSAKVVSTFQRLLRE